MELELNKDDLMIMFEFFDELKTNIETIESSLLKLEVTFDISLVNEIYRHFHTIKGASSFINLSNIRNLSHSSEELLNKIKEEKEI
ncbi:MAG TPA: Hpt domain-containing protein, partial [bacterium]|nr:Hpt domain-containing protein [bacterium]